jgi:hypothetical protein
VLPIAIATQAQPQWLSQVLELGPQAVTSIVPDFGIKTQPLPLALHARHHRSGVLCAAGCDCD